VARSTMVVLKLASLVGFAPSLMIALTVFWPGQDLISSRGYYVGQDFMNFWMAGHLAIEGHVTDIYNVDPDHLDAYNAAVQSLFPKAHGFLNFSYPPHILPLLAVIGALPYGVALAAWQVVGLAGFLIVSSAGAERAKAGELMKAALLSPVVVLVVTVGQASFFIAMLFVGGLAVLPRRPALAGVLFGLLTLKPQLGLLLPAALLITGEYRAFAAASVTAGLLIGLSLLLFGLGPWYAYAAHTLPFQQRLMSEMIGIYPTMMITPYAEFWWLGVPAGPALVLHGLVATGVAGCALATWHARIDRNLKNVVLALASLVVVPYCLNYDLAIPAAALLSWATRGTGALAPLTLAALGLFWFVPYVGMVLVLWGIPLLPVAVLALLAALVYEAWNQSRRLAVVAVS
jgi:alpha-1,2-mannosyltransferase